jgi:hypothetical protein
MPVIVPVRVGVGVAVVGRVGDGVRVGAAVATPGGVGRGGVLVAKTWAASCCMAALKDAWAAAEPAAAAADEAAVAAWAA